MLKKAELELIFDRLYSADNKVADTNGTGLGLPICRSLVELHQGKITAETQRAWRYQDINYYSGVTLSFRFLRLTKQHLR